MPYGNINVDTVTTSTAGGVLGAGNASIMKNRIINGAMVIDQRNAGASVTATTAFEWFVDRWQSRSGVSSKFSGQQNAGLVTPPTGFSNYLGMTSLSAYSVSSSDYFLVRQPIEGFNTSDLMFGTANAKTITLSFQVYSSLTGTFAGAIRNSANSRSYVFTFSPSAANTWTSVSITVAGDTTGTWVGSTNGIGMEVVFNMGAGSTYQGTANAWNASGAFSTAGAVNLVATSGATFYITGVQLEVGSSATGYEYVNYETSLANCQRYYSQVTVGMQLGYVGYGWYTYAFPVTMRATPTQTLIAAGTRGNTAVVIADSGALDTRSGYFQMQAVNGNDSYNSRVLGFSAEL
jgi:hypothetical protein